MTHGLDCLSKRKFAMNFYLIFKVELSHCKNGGDFIACVIYDIESKPKERFFSPTS